MVTVIDGRNLIHGRLASVVAERIMDGEEIVVLNAEAIVITGPFYPRRADLLFKRCVRGMIPWTSTSGREAYRRLHVFVGTPKQFQDCEKERPEEACRKITGKYTTLGRSPANTRPWEPYPNSWVPT